MNFTLLCGRKQRMRKVVGRRVRRGEEKGEKGDEKGDIKEQKQVSDEAVI
jgi:hypothetical protein